MKGGCKGGWSDGGKGGWQEGGMKGSCKGGWSDGGMKGGCKGGWQDGGMKGMGFKGGKGFDMKGKGKGKDKGKPRGPSGPGLERTRISTQPVTGEVADWKGKYGWITPTVPVEHPAAAKNKGNIYASMTDLQGGLTALTVGSLCQFHVFSDASGLGAEEVIGS